jgi:hypothetical protein
MQQKSDQPRFLRGQTVSARHSTRLNDQGFFAFPKRSQHEFAF